MLSRFVVRACRAARLHGRVSVLVTTNREMRALNNRFRKKDKPTDVLSFPAAPDSMSGIVGDIAISAEIAASNAKQLGHSEVEEIKILALHGILHLAGFDHERDNGEMATEEVRLRSALRLPISLIERSEAIGDKDPAANNSQPDRRDVFHKRSRTTRKLR
ncbi:MAG TPA: rRNA maturation RNase YbeY [Terriglobales bacterium]|nr:rRNA maturation RNase YbeY [Terriglobales bacterium]